MKTGITLETFREEGNLPDEKVWNIIWDTRPNSISNVWKERIKTISGSEVTVQSISRDIGLAEEGLREMISLTYPARFCEYSGESNLRNNFAYYACMF